MTNAIDQFSEFAVKKSTVKFKDATAAERMGCVGSLTETMNTKTVTKKCEGVTVKSVTRGDGTGELIFTLHMRRSVFVQSYGMKTEGYKNGVYSYGQSSKHKEFLYTAEVENEDGDILYKAYPRCCITSARSSKVENGADEVSEIECTASVMPDEYGEGVYEALAADLDAETAAKWLTEFTRELITDTAA